MKRLLAIIALLGLLTGGVWSLTVPRMADGQRQGQAVAARLAAATGQRVQISGAVGVTLWPRSSIVLHDLSLVSADGKETLLTAPEMELDVSFRGLLTGDLDVRHITLNSPEMVFRRTGGKLNWNPMAIVEGGFESLSLQRGRLVVMEGQTQEAFEDVSGTLSHSSLMGWARLDLNAMWRQAPVKLSLQAGAADAMGLSLVNAALDIQAAGAHAEFSGRLGGGSVNWPADGQIKAKVEKPGVLWALMARIANFPPPADDPALSQPLTLAATLNGNYTSYEARDVDLVLGSSVVKGLVRLVPGPTPGVSTALSVGTIDVSQWPALRRDLSAGNFKLPLSWLGAFELRIAELKGFAAPLSNVRLKGELKSGVLSLTTGGAMLPGASQVTLTGTVMTAATPVPQADLRFDLDTSQLGELVKATGMSGLPEGVRQLKLSAALRGPWNRIAIPSARLTLDGAEITGQASRRDDGVWDAHLSAERVDLARYFSGGQAPLWIWNLPPFKAALSARQVRAGQQVADNVSADLGYDGKALTVSQLNLRSLDGTSLSLTGTLGRDATVPFDLSAKLTTPDFGVLRGNLPAVASLLPETVGQSFTGSGSIETRWRVTGDEVSRLSVLSLSGGRLDTVVTAKAGAPVAFRIRARHEDTAAFFKRLALPYAGTGGGALDLYAEGTSTANGQWEVSRLEGQAAGLQVADGALTVSTRPVLQWDGRLNVSSADIAQLLGAVDVKALVGSVGRLEFAADRLTAGTEEITDLSSALRFAGGRVDLEQFTGKWRGGTVSSTASADMSPASGVILKGNADIKGAAVNWRGGPRFGLAGELDLRAQLETQGLDRAGWIRALKGSGEFSIAGGKLSGLDFTALKKALASAGAASNLDALFVRGGQSDLSAAGGDFVIADGVVSVPALSLASPDGRAAGGVQIDLAAPRLDGNVRVTLGEGNDAPRFGMTVAGALDDLAGTFDTTELAAKLAPKPVEAVAAAPVEEKKPEEAAAADIKDAVKPPEKKAATKEPEKKEAEAAPVSSKTIGGAGTSVNRKKAAAPPSKPGVATPSVADLLSAMKSDVEAIQPSEEEESDVSGGMRVITPAAGPAPEPAKAAPTPVAARADKKTGEAVLKLPTATGKAEDVSGAPPSLDDLLQQVE